MNIDFNDIIPFLTSPDIQEKLFGVKVGFFVVSGLMLVMLVFLISKTHYFQWLLGQDWAQFLGWRRLRPKKIVATWNKILKRLDTGLEQEYKLAVIEADDMLTSSLRRLGYSGKNLEEMLQKINVVVLPNVEDALEAHRVRNNISRTPDYRLSLDEAKKTLDVYSKAFEILQILT